MLRDVVDIANDIAELDGFIGSGENTKVDDKVWKSWLGTHKRKY